MIQNIFYGQNIPAEHCCQNPNYDTMLHQCSTLAETLVKTLSAEQREIFAKYSDAQAKLNQTINADFYEIGFRDGAHLMIDILK